MCNIATIQSRAQKQIKFFKKKTKQKLKFFLLYFTLFDSSFFFTFFFYLSIFLDLDFIFNASQKFQQQEEKPLSILSLSLTLFICFNWKSHTFTKNWKKRKREEINIIWDKDITWFRLCWTRIFFIVLYLNCCKFSNIVFLRDNS